MARMNDLNHYFGTVNYGMKNTDFWEGSYISVYEEGTTEKAIIYGSNQDDYCFTSQSIVDVIRERHKNITRNYGNEKLSIMRYIIKLDDGKTAYADIPFENMKYVAFEKFIGKEKISEN